jgi:hypothetical protein
MDDNPLIGKGAAAASVGQYVDQALSGTNE